MSASVQAYCVRDRNMVAVQDATTVIMKNGKPAISGVCPNCGLNVFKIGSR